MLSPDLYKNKMVSIECFEKFNHEEEKNPIIENSMKTYILVKSTLVYVHYINLHVHVHLHVR